VTGKVDRLKTWLGRAGLTLLGVGAYVVWGLLDGYDIYSLIAIPLSLGALVGFLLLVLWLSERVSGPVIALVYVLSLAALCSVLWLITGDNGLVTLIVVLVGVLGVIFLIAGLAGARSGSEDARLRDYLRRHEKGGRR